MATARVRVCKDWEGVSCTGEGEGVLGTERV